MRKVDYSEKTLPALLHLLDTWFSKYIRMKDADNSGYVTCKTCGKRVFWKECDCGHWKKRQRIGTRFEERNCITQCYFCNRMRNGQEAAHKIYIIMTYGSETIDELNYLAKKIKDFTRDELITKINYYKEKVSELVKKIPQIK